MITTTDHLQTKKLYYDTAEDCKIDSKNYVNSNKRYFNFCQTLFHAGDTEQFETFSKIKDKKDENIENLKKIDIEKYREFFSNYDYTLYKNLKAIDMYNTFQYIFYKFKKGIYVKIENNYLKVFLPFSNANYVNEWSDRIGINGEITDFFKKVCELEGRTFNPKRINHVKKHWYANNFLIRTEYPINEGDTGVCQYRYILEEICKEYVLPDIEFFINRRDFPILKKDLTEPYEDMYDSDKFPIKKYKYDRYLPIFSMTGTSEYSDLLLPTHDDISRITEKFFNKDGERYNFDSSWTDIPLDEKIPKAVFRGSSTGKGVTIETNPRLRLASMQKRYGQHLDVGITKWNCRPRKISGIKNLQYIDPEKMPFGLVDFLDYPSQAKYRYLIHIEGHSEAYRLSVELNMGSVILMVKSEYSLWFSHLLKPWVHFVPVKSDLSNLIQRIKWCDKNLEKCIEMVKNCKQFYNEYLTFTGVKSYITAFLHNIKRIVGNYKTPNNPLSNRTTLLSELITKLLKRKVDKNIRNFTGIDRYTKKFMNLERDYQYDRLLQVYILCKNHIDSLIFKNIEQIKENQNGSVKKATIPNILPACIKFVLKYSENIDTLVHESFIGLFGVNKVCEVIPTFNYTFLQTDDNPCVVQKYREGNLLSEYLYNTESIDLQYIFNIMCHVLLSVQVAQNVCGFIHNDLFPWNIILEQCVEEREIIYPIDIGKYYSMTIPAGGVMPVIIDYNKSGIIYNGKYIANVNPYKNSYFQDAITLLISILNIILNTKKLEKNELDIVTKLASFICGTDYYPEKYINLKNFKVFLKSAHKYCNIHDCDKGDLVSKRPLDLVKHIISVCGMSGMSGIPINLYEKSSIVNSIVPVKLLLPFILDININKCIVLYIIYFSRLDFSIFFEYTNIVYLHYTYNKIFFTMFIAKRYFDLYIESLDKVEKEKYNETINTVIHIVNNAFATLFQKYIESLKKLKNNNPQIFTFEKSILRKVLGIESIEKLMSANRVEFFENRKGFDKNIYLDQEFINKLAKPVYIPNILHIKSIYMQVYSSQDIHVHEDLKNFMKNYNLENHLEFYKYNAIKMNLE